MPRISRAKEIELRRSAALELAAKGYSQTEIAQKLNYHKSTISNDIRYLKEKAKEQFKRHVEQELPYEHRVAIQGLQYVKRQAITIAEQTQDERIKLHALALFKDVDSDLWHLHSEGEVLGEALEFIKQRKQELQDLEFHYYQHDQLQQQQEQVEGARMSPELISPEEQEKQDKKNNNDKNTEQVYDFFVKANGVDKEESDKDLADDPNARF